MISDEFDADYYRRRADSQAALAAKATDAKVRDLHRELATLYAARATIHAERANGIAPIA